MKKYTYFIALMLLFITTATNAANWRTCDGDPQKWKSHWTNMYISTTSFPIGSAYELRTQYAMYEWNDDAANFNFYVGRDTDGTHNNSNGRNEIYWKSQGANNVLGTTYSRWNCYWLFGWKDGYLEADIGMNSYYSWTTAPYRGGPVSAYNFEIVMLHELGHALGLLHNSNGRLDTMNSAYANGGPTRRQEEPHADSRYGIRRLYGKNESWNDLVVTRFKADPNNLGRFVDENGVYMIWDVMPGLPGGEIDLPTISVSRGETVRIEYTLLNYGTSTISAPVKFYISTNDYISSADTYVGFTSWSMPENSQVTARKTITVPNNLTPGQSYYFGYRVNPDYTISEKSTANSHDANYVRIYVVN